MAELCRRRDVSLEILMGPDVDVWVSDDGWDELLGRLGADLETVDVEKDRAGE